MPSDRDQLSVDIGGRESSGRNYRILADEYTEAATTLRGGLGGALPDLPEITGPYRELLANLHERVAYVEAQLRHAGDGQVKAAGNIRETEHALGETSTRIGLEIES